MFGFIGDLIGGAVDLIGGVGDSIGSIFGGDGGGILGLGTSIFGGGGGGGLFSSPILGSVIGAVGNWLMQPTDEEIADQYRDRERARYEAIREAHGYPTRPNGIYPVRSPKHRPGIDPPRHAQYLPA